MLWAWACVVACLACGAENSDAAYRVDTVLSGLSNPWAVVPADDGSLFITETRGRIRVVTPGGSITSLQDPPRVVATGQGGLLDLAFHPDFATNRWLYLAYSVGGRGSLRTRVTRFTLKGHRLMSPHPIVDGPPGTDGAHFGCRLLFGPDRKLYITLGERHQPRKAQDLRYLHGKILRVNDDGSIPHDNPFVARPHARGEIFTYGHRNPQGLDVHPVSGVLYATEHGPSGYDAPHGGDEINIIKGGNNYGWPVIHHRQRRRGMVTPRVEYTPAVAPSGAVFYVGGGFPQWKHDFFFAALRGQAVHRIKFDGTRVVEAGRLLVGEYGRLRDVASGHDGSLYVLTTSGRLLRMRPE